MAVAGLVTISRQASLLQLNCELGLALGGLSLRNFQSRFDDLVAQFFKAGFPGGGADGEVAVGAIGPKAGLACGLLNGRLDCEQDLVCAGQDMSTWCP